MTAGPRIGSATGAERTADLRLTILPEPTEDELAAVVAAVAVLLDRQEEPAEPRRSRWAMAGRLSALRTGSGDWRGAVPVGRGSRSSRARAGVTAVPGGRTGPWERVRGRASPEDES